MKKLLPVVLSVFLIAASIMMSGCSGTDESTPTMQVPVADTSDDTPTETGGEEEASEEEVIYAPDFTLPGLNGESYTLSDFRGKFVLLNFWATWCSPCQREMPHFEEIAGEWEDRGLVILGVSVGESESTVQKFIDKYGYSFPIALDSGYSVAPQYAVGAYPTTYFVDENGIIQGVVRGMFPDKEYIEEILESLIQ